MEVGRVLVFLYGLIAYAAFFGAILYAIGFVGNILVSKSIDGPATVPFTEALMINAALLGLFAVQHSVMARQWFKRLITRIIPEASERSTYVLLSSAILSLLYWKWQPMEGTIWSVEGTWATVLQVFFWMGWGLLFLSSFLINHFDLFGLRQVYLNLTKKDYTQLEFKLPSLYKIIRHPLYLGFIIGVWATPNMSVGHLVFSIATTAYIFVGIQFEERDLVRIHGENYTKYQKEVPMILPIPKGSKSGGATPEVRPSEG